MSNALAAVVEFATEYTPLFLFFGIVFIWFGGAVFFTTALALLGLTLIILGAVLTVGSIAYMLKEIFFN